MFKTISGFHDKQTGPVWKAKLEPAYLEIAGINIINNQSAS